MEEPTTCSGDDTCPTDTHNHIEQFWRELETGHVRLLVETFRNASNTPNWDRSSYSDEVAKALVGERATYLLLPQNIHEATKVERLALHYDPIEREPFTLGAPTGEYVRYVDYAELAAWKIGLPFWHPIETAPMDGREIDIWIAGPGSSRIANCRWGKPSRTNWGDHCIDDKDLPFQWVTRDGFALDRRNGEASHWMFPPDGPSPEGQTGSPSDQSLHTRQQYA